MADDNSPEKPEEAKPAPEAAKPEAAKPEAAKPEAAKPDAAAEKPAAAPAAAKPAADAAAKPAAPAAAAAAKPAAPAAAAKPKEEPPAPPAQPGQFEQFLKEHGVSVERLVSSCGVETIACEGDQLHQLLRLLKTSGEIKLDLLLTVSGVETADTFDSVYHLWSYDLLHELVVKVRVAKASVAEGHLPAVPSISNFWPAANWHERETYDLMGIRYSGHPYPRRILNPWDWDGYPLRKDYKQPLDGLNDKNPHSMR